MITALVALMLNSSSCQNFLSNHIIADDPRPYAEHSTKDLLEMYDYAKDPRIAEELAERIRLGVDKEDSAEGE